MEGEEHLFRSKCSCIMCSVVIHFVYRVVFVHFMFEIMKKELGNRQLKDILVIFHNFKCYMSAEAREWIPEIRKV